MPVYGFTTQVQVTTTYEVYVEREADTEQEGRWALDWELMGIAPKSYEWMHLDEEEIADTRVERIASYVSQVFIPEGEEVEVEEVDE